MRGSQYLVMDYGRCLSEMSVSQVRTAVARSYRLKRVFLDKEARPISFWKTSRLSCAVKDSLVMSISDDFKHLSVVVKMGTLALWDYKKDACLGSYTMDGDINLGGLLGATAMADHSSIVSFVWGQRKNRSVVLSCRLPPDIIYILSSTTAVVTTWNAKVL